MTEINYEQSTSDEDHFIVFNNECFFYKNEGNTRRVFANEDKTFVLKIPIGDYGLKCNKEEFDFYNNGDQNVKDGFAHTELLNGFIIKQEYLHTLDDEETSKWLGRTLSFKELRLAASCRNEVGFDNNKKLKCYDYDEFNTI